MRQTVFALNLGKLLVQLVEAGYDVVVGEVDRPQAMQNLYLATGKSKVKHSKHQDSIAADIFLYKNGVQVGSEGYAEMGRMWKELHPENIWGGDWKSFHDQYHIQYGV